MTERQFNADDPIAYLITWTTYGTWLPGDERGWHKWGGGGLQEPNEFLKTFAESTMKEPEFTMSPSEREIVAQTVAKHCQVRNWMLHKVNARSNHVHVAVTAPRYKHDVPASRALREHSILRQRRTKCDAAEQDALITQGRHLNTRCERHSARYGSADLSQQHIRLATDATAKNDEFHIDNRSDGCDVPRDPFSHICDHSHRE